MADIVGLVIDQHGGMGQRLGHVGPHLQYPHIKLARGGKARRDGQRALQPIHRFIELALPPRHFAAQPQRRRIARQRTDARIEQCLSPGKIAVVHGQRRLDQHGIAGRCLHALYIGDACLGLAPGFAQGARQRVPRQQEIGFQRHCALQRGYRQPDFAQPAVHQRNLERGHRRTRLFRRQFDQHGACGGQIAQRAQGLPLDQYGLGMARHRAQDLARLRQRHARVVGQHGRGMGERGIKRNRGVACRIGSCHRVCSLPLVLCG